MDKKYIFAGILIFALIPALVFIFVNSSNSNSLNSNRTSPDTDFISKIAQNSMLGNKESDPKLFIASSSNAYNILLANTEALRKKGLGGRTAIAENEVMLFVFKESAEHFFWMKDMLFPIDIVWLDSDKKIIHIENNVSPDSYPKSFGPQADSRYVLEFKEGTALKENLKVGSRVVFK